jgi:hypothetical protein
LELGQLSSWRLRCGRSANSEEYNNSVRQRAAEGSFVSHFSRFSAAGRGISGRKFPAQRPVSVNLFLFRRRAFHLIRQQEEKTDKQIVRLNENRLDNFSGNEQLVSCDVTGSSRMLTVWYTCSQVRQTDRVDFAPIWFFGSQRKDHAGRVSQVRTS